jgi:t-SNARE complex subunit (syntaxin)
MMNIKIIPLGLITLFFIFAVGCKKDSILYSERHAGNTLVTFDGGKITSGDLENYKKHKNSALSDKQALEMMIEKDLLYKEAQAQNLTATLKEAKAESDKQKSMYEQYGTEQEKKEFQDILKELNISEKEYWNDYSPKAYRKQITIARMEKSIKDKIYADIIKKHSNWGQAEIKKGFDESYSRAINDLKTKYNLQYVSS